MSQLNLRRIDLNLLTIFEVVYEEKNQRKAAERLFLTQPAVSSAISRLRDIVQDKLFIVTVGGLQPTQQADDLYAAVHSAFGILRNSLGQNERFVPQKSRRTYTLAIDYGSGAIVALPLAERLRDLAPNVQLKICTMANEAERLAMLRSGEIDLVISQYRADEKDIECTPYNIHKGVYVVREGHPRITQSPDLEDLLGEKFVMVVDQVKAFEVREMDDLMGVIKDRLVLEVPSAAIIPSIIRRSDWVALMSKQTLAALDCSNGLQTYDLDFSYTPRAAFMHWHIRSKDDPGWEWFREQVVTVLENYKDT